MGKIKKFFSDFKTFITKGNVLNLAVGVIIGAAFGKIVSSLVGDIIMPLITRAMGASSLADLSFTLRPEVIVDGVVIQEALAVKWGSFLQNIIDFLIIAFIVFIFVRILDTTKATTRKLAANALKLLDIKEKTEEQAEEQAEKQTEAQAEEQTEAEAEEQASTDSDTAKTENVLLLKNIEALLMEINDSLKK